MRSRKGKGRRAILNLITLGIVLFGLNTLIDFLREGMSSETRVYEIARASNQESKTVGSPQTPDPKNGELVYPLSATFTAYSASVRQTDDRPREMASMKEVYEGAIACPDIYIIKDGKRVWGQKIEIEGLGVFTCDDRMNKRYRDMMWFDIFMESEEEAFEFGKHQLNFRLLP